MSYPDPTEERSKGPETGSEPSSVFDIEATKEIFDQLKKINDALPGAHQSLLSIVENAGTNQPKPRTYATYLEIMDMVRSGVTVYTTSKKLRIPYSTCHAYTKMTPEQIDRLRVMAEEEAALAASEAPAASEALAVPETPVVPVVPEAPVAPGALAVSVPEGVAKGRPGKPARAKTPPKKAK